MFHVCCTFCCVLGSKADRRTNYVSFRPTYWDPGKTDKRFVTPHIGIQVRKTDGQTLFHFTPTNWIDVR